MEEKERRAVRSGFTSFKCADRAEMDRRGSEKGEGKVELGREG